MMSMKSSVPPYDGIVLVSVVLTAVCNGTFACFTCSLQSRRLQESRNCTPYLFAIQYGTY